MKKKVTALVGSPRKGRSTDVIMDMFLKGIEENNDVEIQKYYLKDMVIGHCIGCGYCEKHGVCFQKDDFEPMYSILDKSDGIILGAPIYFNSLNSITKAMIDRCQAYWASKYVYKKPIIERDKKRHGGLIVVGGETGNEHVFDACLLVTEYFFKAVNTKEVSRIFMNNSDHAPAKEREDILEKAYRYGKDFFKDF